VLPDLLAGLHALPELGTEPVDELEPLPDAKLPEFLPASWAATAPAAPASTESFPADELPAVAPAQVDDLPSFSLEFEPPTSLAPSLFAFAGDEAAAAVPAVADEAFALQASLPGDDGSAPVNVATAWASMGTDAAEFESLPVTAPEGQRAGAAATATAPATASASVPAAPTAWSPAPAVLTPEPSAQATFEDVAFLEALLLRVRENRRAA